MRPTARLLASLCLVAASLASWGRAEGTRATPPQAVAMVKKAVAAIHQDGPKAYRAITDRRGAFVEDDLYVTVWGFDGVVRAHGANANMVGRNLIDLKDIDGKAFIRERLERARAGTAFWHDYQYTHPETRRIEPKRMYCEPLDDSVVCAGVYL